ncbi:MAG: DUF3108 domain-containing protein [Bacteroidales bacterium]|nr:DUF3108 domain-containing protein [Bacteroidales bacterium]
MNKSDLYFGKPERKAPAQVILIHLLIIPALFLIHLQGITQPVEKPFPFIPFEQIRYKVSYNLGFIWLDAGEVLFRSDTVTFGGEPAISLYSFGTSYQIYDILYTVRDRFSCVAGTVGLEPILFTEDVWEGKRRRNSELCFRHDEAKLRVAFSEEKSPGRDTVVPLRPGCRDVLTAVYYLRSLDYDGFLPGDSLRICVYSRYEERELTVLYHGKENIVTRMGDNYLCHRFSAVLFGGTIFREGEAVNAWVTADQRKVPVLVEADILVGSIKVYLDEYTATDWDYKK